MTAAAERRLLAEYLSTAARFRVSFVAICDRSIELMPMGEDRIDRLGQDDDVLIVAFLKRFEQYEACLNRTLKTISQIVKYGKVERLVALDVGRRAEKFGIVDERRWGDAVRARNALVHEYPLRPDKRAEQVNRAWDARDTLETTWQGICRFVEEEHLINER